MVLQDNLLVRSERQIPRRTESAGLRELKMLVDFAFNSRVNPFH